ncbi:MAG TPA: AtzH-like domain-containing protein [Candidatus Dormibacteraeota bacterium]|nr:AtzH-like domain-containing protein [Candidatus Dormibacteraeota bacterium]
MSAIARALQDERVVAEVRAQFDAYETALLANDVEALDGFFWSSDQAVRYGIAETLYGAEEIAAYRRGVLRGAWERELTRVEIRTFGNDVAVVAAEWSWEQQSGRQTQTWVRLPEGWRVVCGHVSLVP